MLLIQTDIGNFSDFKSLYFEMKNSSVDDVKVVTKYIGTVVFDGLLTFDEVEKLYLEGK